jgi:hypothetical protein
MYCVIAPSQQQELDTFRAVIVVAGKALVKLSHRALN